MQALGGVGLRDSVDLSSLTRAADTISRRRRTGTCMVEVSFEDVIARAIACVPPTHPVYPHSLPTDSLGPQGQLAGLCQAQH